jgi:tRNA threonylcarbamoyl adenosine modification protein YjeE
MIEKLRKHTSNSEADTQEFAKQLSTFLKGGDIVLLEGNLGTGKTFLVQQTARFLGVDEPVTSPTFSIMQHYRGEVTINHFDFYRLENEMELENLGWEEIVYSNDITFIEWPQLVKEKIDLYYLITIELQGNIRNFELHRVAN